MNTLILTITEAPALACITCNQDIQNAIWNSTFYPNLFTMLSAFIALAVVVAVLSAITARRHRARLAAGRGIHIILSPVPLTTAATILGIGLGGFADGIALHQVLQWHEMLSNRIPATDYVGKSVNMFWDGIFHAFCLLVTLVGIILMWRLQYRTDADRSGRLLGGGLLLGWRIFNLIEGAIDHHWLKLHNVAEYAANHDIANYTFMGVSVVFVITGCLLTMRRKQESVAMHKEPSRH